MSILRTRIMSLLATAMMVVFLLACGSPEVEQVDTEATAQAMVAKVLAEMQTPTPKIVEKTVQVVVTATPTVTLLLLLLHCYCYAATATATSKNLHCNCYTAAATATLPLLHCHCYAPTQLLLLLLLHCCRQCHCYRSATFSCP